MALSNAEKQAAYRQRYAEYKQRVAELEEEVARLRSKHGAPAVPEKAAERLERCLQTLFEQGCSDMARWSPQSVVNATVQLERQLIELGVVPPSKRAEDSIRYAESIKRRHLREANKAVEMSAETHRRKMAAAKRG